MDVSVASAIERLARQGFVGRTKERFIESMIAHVVHVIGHPLPAELEALYRERVRFIADFSAILPHRSGRMGFGYREDRLGELLPVQAIPVFSDGCGSLFGLDLASGDREPAVYFFDHQDGYGKPNWAAGSTLGRFLLLLSLTDKAIEEEWAPGWELQIDPEIDNCPRARAIWNAK